jgi:hypothetical protein
VAPAKAGCWFQGSGHQLLNGLFGRSIAVDHERFDPVLVEVVGRSPSHAATENSTAILKCRHDAGMAMGLVVMPVFAFALSLGVGGVRVGPYGVASDIFTIDIEHDEALGSPEVL